ncbi:LysM peptidoglycan-binding domain-containing protein [Vibrio quintilis]|uniref:Membrane-bound lytic murein transglycosylase D n=1 Tax=Vibrio quintilis TaxID=1117707 RepID=A0A1M7Z0V7_9VIBR|nr:LysM peptidoglycan-binding domain-containing protein [Vibrio quintilis]SHO58567.1 Membrane-bound lytic murein transglycosylase D precursor [Vibrio quintilis]
MRNHIFGVLLLLLAGCQTTQTSHQTAEDVPDKTVQTPATPSENEVAIITPQPQSVTVASYSLPQDQSDLWQRISMQFSLPIPQKKSVKRYRDWYLKHPRHLVTVAQRATPFLYLITKKIEQRNLPLELALLPVVESSFDAFAYSHGRAAGLWQFVPSTGKTYGLQQNFWYDGRRDVNAATDAALNYLTYLNRKFKGDWFHAIAAYNSGSGRVDRAIRKNKKKGKPTDFFSLDLPKETSSYVPKLLALVDVMNNREKYGLKIPQIANKPFLQQVNPKEQLDLAVAAQYADISVKELQSYNPAYNQWATAPDGPYNLLLPIDKVNHFNHSLDRNRGKGIKLIHYKVHSGDTLSTIARKYKTTRQIIQNVNGLSGNLIRAGQYLMIPTSAKGKDTYVLSLNNRIKKIQSKRRGQYRMMHTVRSGESLWSIAGKYKISHTSLAKWNGMSPKDPLKTGKKLVIWKKSTRGAIIRPLYYQVRSGDTLSGIASKFRIKTSDIIKWNDLTKEKYIHPGRKLKLFVDVTKVST